MLFNIDILRFRVGFRVNIIVLRYLHMKANENAKHCIGCVCVMRLRLAGEGNAF